MFSKDLREIFRALIVFFLSLIKEIRSSTKAKVYRITPVITSLPITL